MALDVALAIVGETRLKSFGNEPGPALFILSDCCKHQEEKCVVPPECDNAVISQSR